MAGKSRSAMMEETRAKLIGAARKAFADKGFAAASMDDLTAAVGLTRGALYHNFGDKLGLLAAVVAEIDGEMADQAKQAAEDQGSVWDRLEAQGAAYVRLALDPEVQRIVLRDGPAFLGDPSRWPSQSACLDDTCQMLAEAQAAGLMQPVEIEPAARLLNGAALNAALWVAASPDPEQALPGAVGALRCLVNGFRAG